MKKALKILIIIVSSLVGLFLLFVLSIWIRSGNRLPALKDGDGRVIENAINEKLRVDIGGLSQGFFLRGEKADNPVLLYLHGGPGSPELAINLPNETSERLEKYFTVCYWDQRGAGMTFSSDTDPSTMTVDQFVEDTREMTEYLQKRFPQKKIYLMGHSWGSYLGIKVVEKYPHLYAAYFGIGQVTQQRLSEQLAYDYMVAHAKEIGDKKTLRKLEEWDKNAVDFPSNDYLMSVRSLAMEKYGIGMMHEGGSMFKVAMQVLYFKGYTLREKLDYLGGMAFSMEKMFGYVLGDNLFESSSQFELPIYILHGKYDYQVSFELAKAYSERITAPKKGFYIFEQSAHSPNNEEPADFARIVSSLLP